MCISIYACAKCLPIFIGSVSCCMVAVAVHLSQTINNLAKILRPHYIYACYMHVELETPNQRSAQLYWTDAEQRVSESIKKREIKRE